VSLTTQLAISAGKQAHRRLLESRSCGADYCERNRFERGPVREVVTLQIATFTSVSGPPGDLNDTQSKARDDPIPLKKEKSRERQDVARPPSVDRCHCHLDPGRGRCFECRCGHHPVRPRKCRHGGLERQLNNSRPAHIGAGGSPQRPRGDTDTSPHLCSGVGPPLVGPAAIFALGRGRG
jgi:hypothetical protein